MGALTRRRWPGGPAALAAGGIALRLLLLLFAENRLDCDESAVGVMALDILRGARPFFFYHTAYNGGGALESYLAAGGFALGVPPAVAVKLPVLVLCAAAAFLFSGLCRRTLARREALGAAFFFALGTPFYLEWSLKARGGYVETLLAGILLLYFAAPPESLRRRTALPRTALPPLLFGLVAGLGLWMSEMLLPMIPVALAWMLVRRGRGERRRVWVPLVLGGAVGLMPLALYNLTHHWSNLEQSVIARIVAGPAAAPLGWAELASSVRFVCGPLWWIAAAGGAAAALIALRRRRPIGLLHVLVVYAALYGAGYWLAGLRYLEIPPSRLLFPILPALAVFLAVPAAWLLSRERRAPIRLAGAIAVAAWTLSVAIPLAAWLRSGEPREAGSWRGSWSLVDGDALLEELAARGTDVAFVSYWTSWPLELANRLAHRVDPDRPPLRVSFAIPPEPYRPGSRAAFAVLADSPLRGDLDRLFRANGIVPDRSRAGAYLLFTGIDTGRVHTGAGFPATLTTDRAFPPPPAERDGFN